MERPEPREGLLEVLAAAALEALAGARDQEAEVVARVGVERGEELVGVDVRRRVLRLDPAAVLERLAVARVDLEEHVLQAGLRPQERRGVVLDEAVVLRLELELHDRVAVLELDLADLADLDPGYAHGLALAGLHRLGVGELGLDDERLLLDEREAQPLVLEDVAGHADRDEEEREERDHLAQVLADREDHRSAPRRS